MFTYLKDVESNVPTVGVCLLFLAQLFEARDKEKIMAQTRPLL